MIDSYQVPPKIEPIVNSGMGAQKSLALFDRFEFSHYSFSGSRRLMRQFSSVVGVLRSVMDSLRYQPSVRDIIAPQFVGHHLPWFATVASKKALEETLRGTAVPARLKKHINHFAILVHRPPEVMLFAVDLHEDLVDEKRIAVPLMVSLQSSSILPAELYAPKAY